MELLRNCMKKCLFLFFLGAVATFSLKPFSPVQAHAAYTAPDASTLMDLVFVIDNSGSMRKNDPKFITPEVVSTFVDQLPENAQVSMVLFDQDAQLLIPMTPLANPQNRRKVIDSLSKIDYSGQFTNTPVGIESALSELKTNGRRESHRGIIFITDGIVDTGDQNKDRQMTQWLKEDITAKCKQEGVHIFGIALTEHADFSLIQALADRTDGKYFRTFSADGISTVLQQIRSLMKSTQPEPVPELAPIPLLPVPNNEESKSVETVPPVTKEEVSKTEQTVLPTLKEEEPKSEQTVLPTLKEEEPKTEQTVPPTPKEEEPKSEQTAKVAVSTPAPATPQHGNGTVVISEKAAWTISIALAAMVIALLSALIFFFFQNKRRHQVISTGPAKSLNIPKAYLEDQGDILDKKNSPFILDKETIQIGRGQKNDLVIKAPAISGFHATIEFRNMSFYLEDQRSTNGTMLNERRLEANHHVRLKNGDRISFATHPFLFKLAEKKPFGAPVMVSMTALEDKEAEATIVLDLDGMDSQQGLISCIQTHLMHIYSLSANHKEFVNTYFTHDMLEIISTTAQENLQKTMKDSQQYCTPILKNNSLYLICSLPGSIDMAAKWYGMKNNGFTQFLFKWIRSEQYISAKCEQLCVVTFGQDPATWVSITVVPSHSRPDPIEVMSVDFLNDEEKSSLALDFDHHGRVV